MLNLIMNFSRCLAIVAIHFINLTMPIFFLFKIEPCVFLGYSPFHNGYKCLNGAGWVFLSRHVQFDENVFPFDDPKFTTTSTPKPKQIFLPVLSKEIV